MIKKATTIIPRMKTKIIMITTITILKTMATIDYENDWWYLWGCGTVAVDGKRIGAQWLSKSECIRSSINNLWSLQNKQSYYKTNNHTTNKQTNKQTIILQTRIHFVLHWYVYIGLISNVLNLSVAKRGDSIIITITIIKTFIILIFIIIVIIIIFIIIITIIIISQ